MSSNHWNRRDFLKRAGAGTLGSLGGATLPEPALHAAAPVPEMKIVRVDVVRDHQFEGRKLQPM